MYCKIRRFLWIQKTNSESAFISIGIKADKMMKEHGYKSRNEFYTEAVESFIADELLQGNASVMSDKLASVVADMSEDNAKSISKGLFRYAILLERVT